jgi:16S rRNA (cytosine1402-N4)-methyltransferase
MEEQPKKPRRIRYAGTHPRSYKEKYKELQPDNYSADVEKVMQQGRTPAGMHRSICVNEIMDFLALQPGQIGMDATLGYGGHSLEILKRITPGGMLYATDVDPIELPKTRERLELKGFGADVLTVLKMNFSEIDQVVYMSGPLQFVIADLGVSSMQIDNPDRGFSFKVDGPLDLRLNPKTGKSAAAYLKTATQAQLEELFAVNSDEPHAAIISKHIVNRLAKHEIATTTQLYQTIYEALSFFPAETHKEEVKKACQRCFQALRIEVNNEFGVLDKFLDKIPNALASGGKVAILSFHSGEDRRVKKSFLTHFRNGVYASISDEAIRPSAEESNSNPRARSAKLRWAIKA